MESGLRHASGPVLALNHYIYRQSPIFLLTNKYNTHIIFRQTLLMFTVHCVSLLFGALISPFLTIFEVSDCPDCPDEDCREEEGLGLEIWACSHASSRIAFMM